MEVRIVRIETQKQFKQFLDFPQKLYAGCPYWVPDLRNGEIKTLGKLNPAMEFCDVVLFLAIHKKDVVGRIAGIINTIANEKWNVESVRFGWMDFIDDIDVAKKLLGAVEAWGKERGMVRMVGPVGFTNLDKSGLLVEGFDRMSPFTCIYNFPYYADFMERLGFLKDADWTQGITALPDKIPERITRMSGILQKRYGFHTFEPESNRQMMAMGKEMFRVYNEAFNPIYGFSPLSEAQIDDALTAYTPLMNKDYVCLVLDRDNSIAGFAITVPSISSAIKKARGRMFPFGFLYLLHAMHHNDTMEALLVGIRPKYQGMGINAIMIEYLHKNAMKNGLKYMLANPRLEKNKKAQTMFGDDFEFTTFARRRCYFKEI